MSGISHTQDESWPATATVADAPAEGNAVWRFLSGPYPTLVSRLLLGAVFTLAGLTKLGVPASFAASINSYEMPLPDFLVQAMANALPVIELGIGIWLLIGLFTRFSALVSGALSLIFIVALVQAVLRGIQAECGCFGGASANPVGAAVVHALGPVGTFLSTEQADWTAVLRDVIFLAMAVHLWFVPSIFSIDNLRRRSQAAEDEVVEEAAE